MENYEQNCKNICRVCLRNGNGDNMIPLVNNSELTCYGKAVEIIANIQIKNDCLPNKMCQNCLYLLKQAIVFRKMCENSEKVLEKLIRGSEKSDQNINEKLWEVLLFKKLFPEHCSLNNCKVSRNDNSATNMMDTRTKTIKKEPTKEILYDQQISSNTSDKEDINHQGNDEELLLRMEKVANEVPDLSIASNDVNIDTENSNSDWEQTLDSIKQSLNMDPTKEPFRVPRKTKRKLKRKKLQQQNKKPKPIQNQKKNLKCEYCNKVLANIFTYRSHMQFHTGFRYVCEHCAKGCSTLAGLQYHIAAAHNIGKQYICNKCGFKAVRKCDLKEHERFHTGERPYACEKCGLTFRRRFIWKKHSIYHMEKTVQCIHCPRKFYRRPEMLAHSNNVHERVYVYECSECEVTYAKPCTVRRHLVEKHGIAREMQGKIKRVIVGKPIK